MQRETVWLVEDEQGIADTLVYMLQQLCLLSVTVVSLRVTADHQS